MSAFDENTIDSIFHEKQEGSLCAQHCLNALLQGSYFTAVDLAALAQELDEAERLRMAESGVDSDDYRRFLEQPSGNMDDSGYFSVQVISSALELWGLELIPYSSTEPRATQAQTNPSSMKAYICNYRDHWFTIRRLGNQWFNLNSLLSGPELISNTYLTMFLAQLQQEGYSIFVVCGELPLCTADEVLLLRPATQTHKPRLLSEIKSSQTSQEEDPELQKAIRMSLSQEEDGELAAALALSLSDDSPDTATSPDPDPDPDLDEEEQMRQALRLSLQAESSCLPEVDAAELRRRRLAYLESSGTSAGARVNT